MDWPRHFENQSFGGTIALVKNGDTITIDAEKRELTLAIPAKELAARRQA
jgi:dihydroxy-acid dehydratase